MTTFYISRILQTRLMLFVVSALLAIATTGFTRGEESNSGGTAVAAETLQLSADQVQELIANEGRYARVSGVVERVGRDEESGIIFLNFQQGRGGFVAVIFPKDQANFGGIDFRSNYLRQPVAVEGYLAIYNGAPQIVVTQPEQLTVNSTEPAEDSGTAD